MKHLFSGARVVGQDSSCAPVATGAFPSGGECPAQAESLPHYACVTAGGRWSVRAAMEGRPTHQVKP